jgi:hypothetical protein
MFARFLALVASLHLALAGSVSAGGFQNPSSSTRQVATENTQLKLSPDVITQTAAGVVSGDLDLGDILKGAAFAGLGAGLSASIDLGDLLGASNDSLLGIKPLGEGAAGILSPNAILDGFGDSLVSASLSVIQNGGSFGDALAGSFGSFLASQSMAALQNGIGDLTLNGLEEGSLGHVFLHGAVGCAFAEVSGGDCRAGFMSGAAQAIYAGYLDGSGPISDQQALNTAEMIGAFAGFVFSSGLGENVSLGGSVAQSGLQNNYLSHVESLEFKRELEKCAPGDTGCVERVSAYFTELSAMNNAAFLACFDDICRAWHIARLQSATLTGSFDDVLALVDQYQTTANTSDGYYVSLFSAQYTFEQLSMVSSSYDDDARKAFLRDEVAANVCGGSISTCSLELRVELAQGQLLTFEETKMVIAEQAAAIALQQEIAREAMRADLCGSTRGAACETIVDTAIEAERKLWNRVEGGANAVFGLVEIGGATYICGQSIGSACVPAAAMGVHGLDTYNAGVNQLLTGEKTTTIGAALLMNTFGLSETAASFIYDAASLTGEVAAARLAITKIATSNSLFDASKDFVDDKLDFAPPPKMPVWHGSGPAPGVIGLNPVSKSNGALLNFWPDEGVEFIFDPTTSTFLVRAPSSGVKHSMLSDTMNVPRDQVVGGILRRSTDGTFLTNEGSGHFWQNWSPEIRNDFVDSTQELGITVIHQEGM